MRLVVGADAHGMRCVLLPDTGSPIDVVIPQAAFERRERVLIDTFLRDANIAWDAIGQYVSLQLPHSHTSVRVVATILKTSAWYHGKQYAALTVDRLDQLTTDELRLRIKELQGSITYS